MNTTTRIISQRKVNTDSNTGLDRYSQVTGFSVTGKNNGLITVEGRIALVSPTNVCMVIESEWSYTRYDKAAVMQDVLVEVTPAVLYVAGEDMGDGIVATGGEVKTPAVTRLESQVVTPENNKYTALEQNAIGQGIKQMFGLDLEGAIDNGVWVPTNLNMA